MSAIRELIIKMPALVGAAQAERWSKMFELVFDHEVSDHMSVFARKTGEDFTSRVEVFLGILDVANDFEKAEYILDLLHFASLSIDKNIGKDYDFDVLKDLDSKITDAEPSHPDVAAILSVDAARPMTFWAP